MKVLLFGGDGQLGCEVTKRAQDLNFELVSPVISELNITEKDQVQYLADQVKPDLILNCAAYTAVDKAEEEKDLAYLVNRDGTKNIAYAAKNVDCRLIHVSTDYVFDGTSNVPIAETAATAPLGVYGASKLAGESEAKEILGDRLLIIRTSSLHGQYGSNFVHTMLKLFAEREEVSVVYDQYMSPTWAGWLAEVLLDLCRSDIGGVLHASCAGIISWFEFAERILEFSKAKLPKGSKVCLKQIAAADYKCLAARPAYSVMDCRKLEQVLGRPCLDWQKGLAAHLKDINYM